MPGVHQELRRQFARQAENFERPQWSFGDERLLRWVADATPVGGEDRVLTRGSATCCSCAATPLTCRSWPGSSTSS
jgi:hypothetical protein